MASLRLNVSGMHCGNCVTKVEKALKAVAGTYVATVDLEQGIADVDYDGAKVEPGRYVEAIQALGYRASVAA